jgi:hypothetical protein
VRDVCLGGSPKLSYSTKGVVVCYWCGAFDSGDYKLMAFYLDDCKPRLPHYAAIQMKVLSRGTRILRTVVYEGASTCVMSLSCWRALGSPEIVPSPTMLKAFDRHSFKPYGIIPSFPVELGGKDRIRIS